MCQNSLSTTSFVDWLDLILSWIICIFIIQVPCIITIVQLRCVPSNEIEVSLTTNINALCALIISSNNSIFAPTSPIYLATGHYWISNAVTLHPQFHIAAMTLFDVIKLFNGTNTVLKNTPDTCSRTKESPCIMSTTAIKILRQYTDCTCSIVELITLYRWDGGQMQINKKCLRITFRCSIWVFQP